METVKKVIDQIGICQILKHTHDSDAFYTVEISGVQIYLCYSLEHCYTHASGIHSYNPISQRVEAYRHLQQQKGAA